MMTNSLKSKKSTHWKYRQIPNPVFHRVSKLAYLKTSSGNKRIVWQSNSNSLNSEKAFTENIGKYQTQYLIRVSKLAYLKMSSGNKRIVGHSNSNSLNSKKALTENIGKYQTQYLIGFQNSLILKWVVATKGLSDNPTKPIRGAVAIETRSLPHQRPDIWWNHVNHTGERFFGGMGTKYLDQALCHALWNIIYFTKSIYRSTTWHNKVSDFPRHHKTPCIFQ